MADLELNKKYTWQEIVDAYPDLWVLITNIKEKAGEIVTCKLIDVCTADERADCLRKYEDLHVKKRLIRTTYRDWQDEAFEEFLKDCERQEKEKDIIAAQAAIKIIDALIKKYDIPVEKVFNFLDSHIQYKESLEDDDVLIIMMHDYSLNEYIAKIAEEINKMK